MSDATRHDGAEKALLRNSMYLPAQRAIVCTVPKAACSTMRGVLRSVVDLRVNTQNQSAQRTGSVAELHKWFFGHPFNMLNMPREHALAKLSDSSVLKLALLRHPETRFVAGVLDKAHRVVGTAPFQARGCARAGKNLKGEHESRCHLGGFRSVTHLMNRTLAGLERQPQSRRDHHFAESSFVCGVQRVKYDFIGYVENMGSDREHMVKLLASRDSLMHKEVVSKLLSVHLDHASYTPMHIPHELCQRFADVYRQDVRLLCG